MRRRIEALCILALALAGSAADANAWTWPDPPRMSAPGGPRPGQALKDAAGATLGRIEKIIVDAAGRPRQALVRVTRVLRVLPLDALTRSGDTYVTVLSRAELEALPQAE